jgi:hypothetical protein
MATIPISSPVVPFLGLIPGGLSIGRMIRIKGQMNHSGERFAIYVQSGPALRPRDDCSLHLSVRPSENSIVRNHLTNQQWANEELHGGCPIYRGGYFEILILAEPTFFKIAINGTHFCTFNYRLPLIGNSQFIAIEGDCTVSFIGQETDSAPPFVPPPHMMPTPYVSVPYVAPPAIGVYPPPPPPYTPSPYPPAHHTPHHHHHHAPPPPPPAPHHHHSPHMTPYNSSSAPPTAYSPQSEIKPKSNAALKVAAGVGGVGLGLFALSKVFGSDSSDSD